MSASAQPVAYDALEELRAEIEEAAADSTISTDIRDERLREFRGDLVDLLGLIDTYLGDNETERQGEQRTPDEEHAVAQVRENADIRNWLIEHDQATPALCDSLLLWSHAELDDLEEEGLLEEAAVHAVAFMQGLKKFDEKKHPRGRGGKWTQVFGKVEKLQVGQGVHLGEGVKVHRHAPNGYTVTKHDRQVGKHTSVEHATTGAHAALTTPTPPKSRRSAPRRTAAPKHEPEWMTAGTAPVTAAAKEQAKRETAQRAAEKNLPEAERKRLYAERKQQLEQRAAAAVTSAARRGKLTDAEAHFNEAGKVSQRTLANYVEEAATGPQTIDLHSQLDSHGGRVWEQSRRELHERIINAHLKKRAVDPETGRESLDYNPDAEDLAAHPDGPQVLYSGGGYAAGKGSVLKILGARGDLPPDSFTLDPDQIKAELPEFQAMLGTDPEANMHVYREAWAIAQEIQARAMERKLNIVVDGISDTSPEEMGQRARAFTSRGYKARAVYVDIPTEEAMSRAAKRAEQAKSDSDRRMIPSIIMRAVHRDVAATVPSLPGYLDDHQIPLSVEVWSNNEGVDENGQFRPPKQFFSYDREGGRQVLDQPLYDAFLRKGHEPIAQVEGAGAGK